MDNKENDGWADSNSFDKRQDYARRIWFDNCNTADRDINMNYEYIEKVPTDKQIEKFCKQHHILIGCGKTQEDSLQIKRLSQTGNGFCYEQPFILFPWYKYLHQMFLLYILKNKISVYNNNTRIGYNL